MEGSLGERRARPLGIVGMSTRMWTVTALRGRGRGGGQTIATETMVGSTDWGGKGSGRAVVDETAGEGQQEGGGGDLVGEVGAQEGGDLGHRHVLVVGRAGAAGRKGRGGRWAWKGRGCMGVGLGSTASGA